MRHHLKLHENALAKEAQDHTVASDRKGFTDHSHHREAMATIEKLYRERKAEFMQWLVKRM